MATYSVLAPPNGSGLSLEAGAEFIPDTKALMALALPLLWLLWHRMWWASLFYVLISMIFALVLTTGFATLALLMTAIPGLFLFLEGNELRRKALIRKNWTLVAVIEGDNLESAEARFFYSRPISKPGIGSENLSPDKYRALQLTDNGIEFLTMPEGR